MNRRKRGILALCVVLTVVGLTASGEQTPTKPKPQTAPGSGVRFDSWAYSHLATGEGVRLTRTRFEKYYEGNDYVIRQCPGYSSIPDDVSDDTTSSFCYYHDDDDKGFDTGYFFYYDILVPNSKGEWVPSGYWVDGATKVPMMGERKLDCTIKRAGSTSRADGAPFSCETSWTGSGNTSQPHWKVTGKPVTVIDASTSANVARAAKLIGENCESFDTPRCTWTHTQKSSAFLPEKQTDWLPLTDWFDACPPAESSNLSYNNTKNVSWSDTFGGKISGKFKVNLFVEEVEATVEADYHHSITHSDSYTVGYTYKIPSNWRSALYLQHGMLEVTGDFSIINDKDRFLVKNAVFRFPLTKDVLVAEQLVKRGVVHHVDVPCTQKAPAYGAPPPKGATIGLATALGD